MKIRSTNVVTILKFMGCLSFVFISMIIIGFNLLIEPPNNMKSTRSFLRRNVKKCSSGSACEENLNNILEIDSAQLSNVDNKFNDDFCDNNDGSDETRTSACSYILVHQQLFECDQKRKTIYLSRVNDYVCDCEDGSDEINTIKC